MDKNNSWKLFLSKQREDRDFLNEVSHVYLTKFSETDLPNHFKTFRRGENNVLEFVVDGINGLQLVLDLYQTPYGGIHRARLVCLTLYIVPVDNLFYTFLTGFNMLRSNPTAVTPNSWSNPHWPLIALSSQTADLVTIGYRKMDNNIFILQNNCCIYIIYVNVQDMVWKGKVTLFDLLGIEFNTHIYL